MRKSIFTLLCAFCTVGAYAQLVNNGATITVQAGATLMVESNVDNNTGGIINLEGNAILEIKGNFVNTADIKAAPGSTLKFTGTDLSNFNAGGDTIANLVLAKATGVNVSMNTSNAVVTQSVDFGTAGNNKLILGGQTLTLAAGASIAGASPDEYIVADGMGKLVKSLSNAASGSFTFPVGDADEYSPLTSAYTTSAGNAQIGVNLVDGSIVNKPTDATDHISRTWDVDVTAGTIASQTLTGTYLPADITGTASLIKGASQAEGATGSSPNDWSFVGAAAGTNTVTGTSTLPSTEFTGMNFFGKGDIRVFLAGAYNIATNTMRTDLNTTSNPLVPGINILKTYATSSPYTALFGAPAVSVAPAFFDANPSIVDWILVEARDQSTPATTLISQTSAFLKNDGTIINIDGTPLSLKNANNNVNGLVHISIKHRNHLAIRTPGSGINVAAAATPQHLFYNANQAFNLGSCTECANPSTPLRLINSNYVMWGGDATSNSSSTYNGSANDKTKILQKVGLTTPNNIITGYNIEDVNLDGIVTYNGSNNDKTSVLQQVGLSTSNSIIISHQ
jgi:hypothetical protein